MKESSARWQSRPILNLAIRVLVLVVPILAAVGSAFLLRAILPEPQGLAWTIAWVISIAVPATLVLKSVEFLARKLLPLAALLNMSLLFPDEAPSRISLARRSGRVRDLKKTLFEMKEHGVNNADTRAAEKILSLAAALAAHDKITRGHSERVRVFTDLLADEMKLSAVERDHLRWAALLHDIGKLLVPQEILNKTGQLEPHERAIVERHPIDGRDLIAPIAGWLGQWGDAVVEHHERFDGAGYPFQVRGANISLGARIVTVADTYECITSTRPYSKPLTTANARREIARVSGTQFDPRVVRAFLNISIAKLWRGAGLLSWIAAIPYFPNNMIAGARRFGRTVMGGATTVAAVAVIFAIGVPEVTVPSRPSSVLGSKLVRPADEPASQPATDAVAEASVPENSAAPGTASPNPVASSAPTGGVVGSQPGPIAAPSNPVSSPKPGGGSTTKSRGRGTAKSSSSHGECVSTAAHSLPPKTKGSVRDTARSKAPC